MAKARNLVGATRTALFTSPLVRGLTIMSMIRGCAGESALLDNDLGLAVAPVLTPTGLVPVPSFFHGLAARPQVLARGLVVHPGPGRGVIPAGFSH
ncbi:MAG: hypothetical protein FWH11_12020 [Micrococcales bacterium]|nr:hypothetical protein [Micrococcales bacterium]